MRQVFYISTLKIFLVTLDCMGTDGAWVFSQLRCWETSHIILASVGATFVVIFALTAIFVGLVSFEVCFYPRTKSVFSAQPDPNTADLTGTAVARSTVTDVLMKTVMTLAAVLLKGRGNWESFTYLATNAILLYNVVLLVPYANNRTNYFRCGLYTMSVWSAGVLFIRKVSIILRNLFCHLSFVADVAAERSQRAVAFDGAHCWTVALVRHRPRHSLCETGLVEWRSHAQTEECGAAGV